MFPTTRILVCNFRTNYECLQNNVIYEATVRSKGNPEKYSGNKVSINWEATYRKYHQTTAQRSQKINVNQNTLKITWRIGKLPTYSNISKHCKLFLWEEISIITFPTADKKEISTTHETGRYYAVLIPMSTHSLYLRPGEQHPLV